MAKKATTTESANQSETKPPEAIRRCIDAALDAGASDLHIDAFGDGYRISYRIDGAVQPQDPMSADDGYQMINQLRVMAEMGVEQVREPREGRITYTRGEREHGVRVSIVPSLGREAAHCRFLVPPGDILDPLDLGMSEEDLAEVKRAIRQQEGLAVVAGPTGSGKTMTLYSLVSMLDLDKQIAVSTEDPVEFDMPFLRQVQVDESRGLTMQQGLLTLLRMDPDTIIVGEARDRDSVRTAAQAAASGHVVYTTLHAYSPAMVIETLRFLGVPDHLLGNTLRLIIVQNLVRRLCPECAESHAPTELESQLFEDVGQEVPETIRTAKGCDHCSDYGYKGRTGIFHTVHVPERLGMAISSGCDTYEINEILQELGEGDLWRDALRTVGAGITSFGEVSSLYRGDRDVEPLFSS